MTALRYRPAPGRRVRLPDGRLLREAGERLEHSPYLARLIADGDIIPALHRSKKA